jgi:hypothetical protein
MGGNNDAAVVAEFVVVVADVTAVIATCGRVVAEFITALVAVIGHVGSNNKHIAEMSNDNIARV